MASGAAPFGLVWHRPAGGARARESDARIWRSITHYGCDNPPCDRRASGPAPDNGSSVNPRHPANMSSRLAAGRSRAIASQDRLSSAVSPQLRAHALDSRPELGVPATDEFGHPSNLARRGVHELVVPDKKAGDREPFLVEAGPAVVLGPQGQRVRGNHLAPSRSGRPAGPSRHDGSPRFAPRRAGHARRARCEHRMLTTPASRPATSGRGGDP